ncbi:MAG: hypothetical protein RMM08_13030 [Armatimonadota bacterium]|nr:hypothetical protein [bacterium]MDW8322275.1 hypothetical protein [Armatimonadota bacterium]
MSFLRNLLEKWRQWQLRRLRHGRTQALWERTKERVAKVLRVYRSLPEYQRQSLREIPQSLQRLQEGIYEHLLVQDRILVHLPPSRWWQQLWYTALTWWYEHRKEYALADTYRQMLHQLDEASRDRYRVLQQAKQIEAQVERWLVELDVLHDRMLLLRSQPVTAPEPPPGLVEALQTLQQEMEAYQRSIEEVQEWLDRRQR